MISILTVGAIGTNEKGLNKYLIFNEREQCFESGTRFRIYYETDDFYIIREHGVRYKVDRALENITYKTGAIVDKT